MGHVEFDGKRNASLNIIYTDPEDTDLVQFEVLTPHGSLAATLTGRMVEEVHASLGAFLALRKQRRRERRSKKRSR